MIALAALALATAQPPPAAARDGEGGAVQVLADFRIAEAERGPLEGRWRITGRRGAPLYLVQLADPGRRPDAGASLPGAPELEGAWLDLGRAGGLTGEGYLAAAKRTGGQLTLLFYESPLGARTIELKADGRGRWRGALIAERRRTMVVMAHEPLFAAAPASGR